MLSRKLFQVNWGFCRTVAMGPLFASLPLHEQVYTDCYGLHKPGGSWILPKVAKLVPATKLCALLQRLFIWHTVLYLHVGLFVLKVKNDNGEVCFFTGQPLANNFLTGIILY